MKSLSIILLFFVYSSIVVADISLKNVQGNLRCTPSTSGTPASSSTVGNQFSMNCNSQSNTYSRLNFDAVIDGARTGRLTKTFFFSMIPGFGSDEMMFSSDGCNPNTFMTTFYKKECVKMGLPLRVLSGLGYSIFPNSDSTQLMRILNISADDLPHIIQGFEVQFSFGWPRWVWQLSNSVDFIFPLAYSFNINDTFAAYNDTVSAAGSDKQIIFFGGQNTSNFAGSAPVFSSCFPQIHSSSSRIGGYLGACFRAACNCSGVVKPADVPDYYTYEVDFVAPTCEVRKILNNGQPRLSTDVVITFNAVVKLRGENIFSEQMLQVFISDLTSKSFNDVSFGNAGAYSGVNNQKNRFYSNANSFSIGTANIGVDRVLFPGVTGANSLVKLKATLADAFLNENTLLGGSLTKTGKVAAPILSGGYIVDCLKDSEVVSSVYRTNANSPYNVVGMPGTICAPPDKWFYLSDAAIRKGVYLGNHFRNSCGKLGTSSAAFFTDNLMLQNFCCNETLVTGSCLPGIGNSSFPSPAQILTNCTIFQSLFTPPGFQAYNFYLIGRNTLNMQMPMQNVSGRDPLLFAAPSLIMNLTLELSDILITGLVGNTALNSNIPPLMLATPNSQQQWFVNDQPFGCIYDSFAGGIGLFYVQRLCNSGTNGGSANISMGVENCQHMFYFNDTLVTKVFQMLDTPLKNQQCTQQVFTVPIKVDLNYYNNITCQNVYFSSTFGSTKEINIPNVKCVNIPGYFTHRNTTGNFTFPRFDCATCSCGDFDCLNYCNDLGNSICFWFVFVLPLFLLVLWIAIPLIWVCIYSARMKTTQQKADVELKTPK